MATTWVDPQTGYTWSADHRYWWDGFGWRLAVGAPYIPQVRESKFDADVVATTSSPGRWGLAATLGVGWLALSEIFLTLLSMTNIHFGLVLGAMFIIAINMSFGIAVLLAMRLGGIDRPLTALGVGRPIAMDLVTVPAWAFLNFVARIGVVIALFAFLPGLRHSFVSNNPIYGPRNLYIVAIVAFVVVLIAPVCEELLFRGLLLRTVTRRYGFNIGATVSSLLFGLAHAWEEPTVGGAVVIVVIMSTFGVMQCLLVRRTSRLVPAMGVHMLTNAAVVAFGLLG